MIYVPGKGNYKAKIIIIGEAPGAEEERQLEPFVGSSGSLLNEILQYANIERSEVYITNVCKIRPPQNDISKLNLTGHSIEEFLPELDEEINKINPNIIFGLGNTPLEYLTGYKGIMTYRGSILFSKRTGHKCVFSIHPAAILHRDSSGSYKDLFLIKQDAVRVEKQSHFPEIIRPDRHITICKNSNQLYQFLERNKQNQPNDIIAKSKFPLKRRCVVDIETFKTFPALIGLAFNSWDAISIPMISEEMPNHDLAYIWEMIIGLFSSDDIQLVGQNAKFDRKRCRNVGLEWKNGIWFDVMQAWHTLFSELRKDLATISSILTEEPYYKSEGKEYNSKRDSIEVWMKYNGKDAYTEWECYERLHEMLIEEGMEEFFFNRIMPLNELYDRIEDIGIEIDQKRRKLMYDAYDNKLKDKLKNLNEILKTILNNEEIKINPNSPKQVAEMIYGQLGIPFRKDTGEDTLKALMNNVVKDPLKKRVLQLILECRKLGKSISTYLEFELREPGYSEWKSIL